MNLQAYAKHRKAQGLRGATHVAVLKAIEAGRLTEPAVRKVDGRWHIDATLADMQWAGNTDNQRVAALPDTPAPAPTGRQPHPVGGGPSLAEARRARTVYQAERERIALLREKGELVPAAEVKARWFEHGRAIRDNLLSIPDRIASQLAASTDAREVHVLLSEEIAGALRVLANG